MMALAGANAMFDKCLTSAGEVRHYRSWCRGRPPRKTELWPNMEGSIILTASQSPLGLALVARHRTTVCTAPVLLPYLGAAVGWEQASLVWDGPS
jgi:hypothetical protein